jgi:hypothetical protein
MATTTQSWSGWTKWNANIQQTLDDAQKAAAGGVSIAEFRKKTKGTGNGVLDVIAVGAKKKGHCWVLTAAELHEHFGSKAPSKKAIEGGIESFLAKLGKGEAVAVTSYARGLPAAVLFAGWNG